VSSSGSKYDKIPFANALANMVHIGDTFVLPDVYCDRTGANYSIVKNTALAAGYLPETLLVTDITIADTSNKYICVIRGNGADPATPQILTTSYKWVRKGPAFSEVFEPPTSSDVEPTDNTNYMQVYAKTASEGEIRKNTDLYAKMTFEQMVARKENELLKQIEYDFIWGIKSFSNRESYDTYTAGGIVEIIPMAATSRTGLDHRVNFGGDYNAADFRKLLTRFSKYGTSNRRLVLTGDDMIVALRNYHEGQIVINDELKNRWMGADGQNVWTWDAGGGLVLDMLVHPVFSRMNTATNGYSRDMLIIDLDQLAIDVLNNMDIRQKDVITTKNERTTMIYGVLGLDRGAICESFGYIYGITG
jgi:hypothetical protein